MKPLRLPGTVAVLLLGVAALPGCLDPLYEDFGPPGSALERDQFVACCQSGRVNTCECQDPFGCLPELKACKAGTCVPLGRSCGGGGADAGSVADSGTSAIFDAGAGTDAGVLLGADAGSADAGVGPNVDGGVSDAGSTDAGQPPLDAGISSPDAGASGEDAGSPVADAGRSDAGTQPFEPTDYELCCNASGQVDTCGCPATGCLGGQFTACPGNRCVPGAGASCS